MLLGADPEVFVVAEFGVLGGEPVSELGGNAFLLAVARPGPPLLGVGVEVLVHPGGRTVGVARDLRG